MAALLWLWNGSKWVPALGDAAGHFQVDVLSSALPSGAATEATLDLARAELNGIETLLAGGLPAALDAGALKVKEQSPISGYATSAKQDTMITALQLIDDLRNALNSVATDYLYVRVLASALPGGAATSAKQDTMITALQLIDDLRNALGSVDTDDLQVDVKTTANPSNLDIALSQIRDRFAIQLARDVTWLRHQTSATNATVNLRTVTTGKTFYLVYSSLTIIHYGTGDKDGKLYLRDGDDYPIVDVRRLVCANAEYGRGESGSHYPPLAVPAGWKITITANEYTTTHGGIFGWEE